jgi:type IV pilus assembly protein PilA
MTQGKSSITQIRRENGFSLIELLIVVAIILIIAGIAIPNLLRSKMSANEASAVSVVRNTHNGQGVYSIQFPAIGYATSLVQLGPVTPCDPTHACLTDVLVGCSAEPCMKGGYLYYMTSTTAAAPIGDYTVSATPIVWSKTGQRNFCSSEDGVVRIQNNATASLGAGTIHSECTNPALYSALPQ